VGKACRGTYVLALSPPPLEAREVAGDILLEIILNRALPSRTPFKLVPLQRRD